MFSFSIACAISIYSFSIEVENIPLSSVFMNCHLKFSICAGSDSGNENKIVHLFYFRTDPVKYTRKHSEHSNETAHCIVPLK